MTDSTDIQAMRDWVAEKVMGWSRVADIHNRWSGYLTKDRGTIRDFKPDKDATQRDAMMEKFQYSLTAKADSEGWHSAVRNDPSEPWSNSSWHESLGLACLIAAAKASGYPDE